jgi:hypothetical protein
MLAAALTGLVAACGSSGSPASATSPAATGTAASAQASTTASGGANSSMSSSASPAATGKLTGAAARALADKAIAGTKAARSVRVSGQNVGTGSGSERVTFDLTLVKGVGCKGTIALSATEQFKIIDVGGYVWMLPNSAFYASLHLSQAAQALLADKYIKVKSTDKQIGTLGQVCSFTSLFGQLPQPSGLGYTATPVSYQGQPAYQITQQGKPGVAVVSNTTPPLLLQISDPKSSNGGTVTFSDYNSVTALAAPPAAETVDGTKLGI